MYNRYIPQNDGTFSRNTMPEPKRQNTSSPPPVNQHIAHEPIIQECNHTVPITQSKPNIGGFLKRLLPQGFDTGDLIIILLLLLMAGDCEEDKNNAILTIALYFLM